MDNLLTFIPTEAYILIAACWGLGFFLKGQKFIKDEFIPIMLLVFACVGSLIILGFNFNSLLIGILVAVCAVGGHQYIKQAEKFTEPNLTPPKEINPSGETTEFKD